MSAAVRNLIRAQRDKVVRRELERLGYVLDYWMVYRVETLVPLPAQQRLRFGSRGSSRRLHEQRAVELAARLSAS